MLLVALLCMATSYILRGTWAAIFFETGAIVLGVIWGYRVVMTHPAREMRLLALLVVVLLWSLMAFYVGAAQGLL
jgi:hypothetical protein